MGKQKGEKYINFWVSEREYSIIKEYCSQERRSQTDVLREFIRNLEPCLHSNAPLNLEQTLLAHDAKELQLLAVGPGMYECYLDGKFFAFGSYEEVMSKLSEE